MKKFFKEIKARIGIERFSGFGLGMSIIYINIDVPHPYRRMNCVQPTFYLILRVICFEFYVQFYRPARIPLNRQERRANHMK